MQAGKSWSVFVTPAEKGKALGDSENALGDSAKALRDPEKALGDSAKALRDPEKALGDSAKAFRHRENGKRITLSYYLE